MSSYPSWLLASALALAACSPRPQPLADAQPAAPASANVSDVDVTEHVTTALLQADTLKGASIEVVTTKGDVRLIGVLDTQAQIDEALRLARAADGAHAIHDELTLRK